MGRRSRLELSGQSAQRAPERALEIRRPAVQRRAPLLFILRSGPVAREGEDRPLKRPLKEVERGDAAAGVVPEHRLRPMGRKPRRQGGAVDQASRPL